MNLYLFCVLLALVAGATVTTAEEINTSRGEKAKEDDNEKSASSISSLFISSDASNNETSKQGQAIAELLQQQQQFGMRKVDDAGGASASPYFSFTNGRPSFEYGESRLETSESDKYEAQGQPSQAAANNDENEEGGQQQQQQQQQDAMAQAAMSVDEAFRKYFPGSKPQHLGAESQPQGQAIEPSYNNEEKQKKDSLTIDSLREIVERQPLAKSNPFDPPSPPLSAFLPPPPNSIPQQASDSVHYDPGQHESDVAPVKQQQQSENGYQDAKYLLQQDVNDQGGHNYQAQAHVETRYVYKQLDAGYGGQADKAGEQAINVNNNDQGGAVSDSEEDEGLPYKTEPVDNNEDGRKVSYVYSKAVQLPNDEANGGQQNYQSAGFMNFAPEAEQIHRKPVSQYDNEGNEGGGDQDDGGDVRGGGDDNKAMDAPHTFQEIDFNQQNMEKASNFMNQQYNQAQAVFTGQANLPVYRDEMIKYNQDKNEYSQPLAPSLSHNFARPNYDEERDNAKSPIEYGGFVPIKKHKGLVDNTGGQQHHHHQENHQQGDFPPPSSSKYFINDLSHNESPKPMFYPMQNDIAEGLNEMPPPPPPPSDNYKNYQMRPQSQQQPHKNKLGGYFSSKIQNLRFKPVYGKDATKKLKDLGINEQEFYGTVNKILQKNPFGKHLYQPKMPRPFGLKSNKYRAPNKNRPNEPRPMYNNYLMDEFTMNALKEDLPPGASYNPRDVGLDESVLAHMHMLDSGIGGHRFANIYPPGKLRPRPPYEKHGLRKGLPLAAVPSFGKETIPYALNSMSLPFVFNAPSRGRVVPYSSTGKGFRSQYGYRAAASELKPQFILPNSKAFASLLSSATSNPPRPSSSSSAILTLDGKPSALVAAGGPSPLGNIFAIKPIKGIKSLMSYLAGGVSG